MRSCHRRGLGRGSGGGNRLLLGGHEVHGNVVRISGERVNKLRVGDDANAERVRSKGCEESVIDPSASAKAVTVAVECKTWNDDRSQGRGADRDVGARDGHVPGVGFALVAVPYIAGHTGGIDGYGLKERRAA